MKARICAWFSGWVMLLLAAYLSPTWREMAVFSLAYVACVIFNTVRGMQIQSEIVIDKIRLYADKGGDK